MAINYNYKPYEEDENTRRLREAALAAEASKPAGYTGANKSAADEALKKVQNREEFKYDVNNDALYQQYKDQAMRQGKLAMEDTIGKASALTGGYGNSYAATAGNQAFQMYLDRLNDRIPELYSAAYSKYQQERQNDVDNYKLLAALDEQEYDRANDDYSKWASETDRAYGRYNDAFDRGYKANSEAQNYLYDIALQNEKSRLENEANAAKKYQADLDYQLGVEKLYAKEAEDAAKKEADLNDPKSTEFAMYIRELVDQGYDGQNEAINYLARFYPDEIELRTSAQKYGIDNGIINTYFRKQENSPFSSKNRGAFFIYLSRQSPEAGFAKLYTEFENNNVSESQRDALLTEFINMLPASQREKYIAYMNSFQNTGKNQTAGAPAVPTKPPIDRSLYAAW